MTDAAHMYTHAYTRTACNMLHPPVALVVIRGNGLGVAVDHHALASSFPDRTHAEHASVVKLHTAADPVGAAAQHDNTALAFRDLEIVLLAVVGGIEVVGLPQKYPSLVVVYFCTCAVYLYAFSLP
jgi:hypothetical protein